MQGGQPLLLLVMDIRISGGSLHSDLLYIGKVVRPIIMMVFNVVIFIAIAIVIVIDAS